MAGDAVFFQERFHGAGVGGHVFLESLTIRLSQGCVAFGDLFVIGDGEHRGQKEEDRWEQVLHFTFLRAMRKPMKLALALRGTMLRKLDSQ